MNPWEASPLRRLLGPPGSHVRRRIRELPILGPLLIVLLSAYRHLRKAREDVRLSLQRARTDFRNNRAITARNITRKNDRRAYERLYRDDALLREYLAPERIDFYLEVAESCTRWHPRSVIDVGCGAGNLLDVVVKKLSPERVVGIDHADAGVARAKLLVPSGEFANRDLYKLDFDETFDLVLCTEVLEHLIDPDRAMNALSRLCGAAGVIVITVPDGAHDRWEGHRNFWTKSELEAFLQSYGNAEVSRMRRVPACLLATVRPFAAEHELARGSRQGLPIFP